MSMKDLLLTLIEFFFEIDSNKDYTLKELLIVILKVVLFLLILTIILYFLLNNKETITISD